MIKSTPEHPFHQLPLEERIKHSYLRLERMRHPNGGYVASPYNAEDNAENSDEIQAALLMNALVENLDALEIPATVVGFKAGRLQVQRLSGTHPPGRKQQHISPDMATVIQRNLNVFTPVFDPLNRGTPRGAMHGYLSVAREGDYERAAEYLDLRQLPEEERGSGPELARQLKVVLQQPQQGLSG